MFGKIASLAITVAVIITFIYVFTKKPKVILDVKGFPINPKDGDTFMKDSILYTYTNSEGWINFSRRVNDSRSLVFNKERVAQIFNEVEASGGSARSKETTLGDRINKLITDSGLSRSNSCDTMLDWCMEADKDQTYSNVYCKCWKAVCGKNSTRTIQYYVDQRLNVCPPGEVIGFNSQTQKNECHPYSK